MRRANARSLIKDSLDETSDFRPYARNKEVPLYAMREWFRLKVQHEILSFSNHATHRLKERYGKNTKLIKDVSDAKKHNAVLGYGREGDLTVITFLPNTKHRQLSRAKPKKSKPVRRPYSRFSPKKSRRKTGKICKKQTDEELAHKLASYTLNSKPSNKQGQAEAFAAEQEVKRIGKKIKKQKKKHAEKERQKIKKEEKEHQKLVNQALALENQRRANIKRKQRVQEGLKGKYTGWSDTMLFRHGWTRTIIYGVKKIVAWNSPIARTPLTPLEWD
jgi:hypothetical protein